MAAYYGDYLNDHYKEPIRKIIQKETGSEIPIIMMSGYSIGDFFKRNELRDVLDSITLIYQVLLVGGWRSAAENWRTFVSRVLKEENMGYQLDATCGIHYLVDEEFERNRFCTLTILDDPKYSNVRAAYEDAYRYMDGNPIDTKAAVRSMFESIEILVKQMVSTKNLNKWIVENTLKEKCLTPYKKDMIASKVVAEFFDGFALWVDGLHNYRHGQASTDPVAPTEEIVIYVLSSGSAFLRLLVGINNETLFRQ